MSYEKQGTGYDRDAHGYERQGRATTPTDQAALPVVANLRSDAAQLIRMSEAAAFGKDLSVRVTRPDLLISNMVAAADALEASEASLAKAVEVLEPFLNVRDQYPESAKVINKAFDGLSTLSVMVTKDQFLAARAFLSEQNP